MRYRPPASRLPQGGGGCRRGWCMTFAGASTARPGCGEPVSWRVITYRLPAEPSRHRVAVWRELRRLGAVTLQQGTWAVPDGEPFEASLSQVVASIKAAGGPPVVVAGADREARRGAQ